MNKSQHNWQQEQHYNIAIYEESTVLTDFESGKEGLRRVITHDQLRRLLDLPEAVREVRGDPDMIWHRSDAETHKGLYRVKKQTWDVFLTTDVGVPPKRHQCHLPAFLLEVAVDPRTQKVFSIRAYCYNGRSITNQTRFYEMPLPNFSGAIHCLGNVVAKVGSRDTLKDAGLRAIFDGEFNNHQNLVSKAGVPFQQYFATYEGKFPLQTLERIRPPNV